MSRIVRIPLTIRNIETALNTRFTSLLLTSTSERLGSHVVAVDSVHRSQQKACGRQRACDAHFGWRARLSLIVAGSTAG